MNFYEFEIPTEINGTQLKEELNCDEVYIMNNKLIIGGNLTETQAAAGLAAHMKIATDDNSAAKTALLAKLGITEEEARLLLN